MKCCKIALPEREELRGLPQSPRLINEIAHMMRYRIRGDGEKGVMAQNTARLVMAHLAVLENATQLRLAELTHLKPPTVSVLLRRMEAEGYVCRVKNGEDRREMRVSLSEKGRAFDRDRLQRISTNDETAMKGFTAEEAETLERLLLRVRENLSERGE